jgi:hypothetical protein
MSELLLQIRHEHIFLCQLLLLRADGLDKLLHYFLVILLKECYMLVTLRALCRIRICHNARGATHDMFFNLVLLELHAGWESAIMLRGYSLHLNLVL